MSSWPGSEVPILGKLPTYYFPYDNSVSSSDKFNQCLEWLDMESSIRPSLLTAYLGNIDSAAHSFGTTHPQVSKNLRHKIFDFNIFS